MSEEKDELLIPRDQYLAAGIHIGTQIKTRDMVPYIYRITRAGLYVIDIRQTDARMRIAAKFLSRFDINKIVVVSARRYGHNPILQLARIIGGHAIPGRFVPGTLTNPNARSYLECDLLVITDPRADKQALKEAKIAKIPVVGFCDTDNNLTNIDLSVPANNRGRKALALIFWLLTRGVLLEKGEIARPEDFTIEVNSFQSRGPIFYETTGDQKTILEKMKERVVKEKGEGAEEKAEEEPIEEPEAIIEEEPEEKPEKTVKEKPEKKLEEEVEKEVIKPEDLIEGPLPEEKPKEKPEEPVEEKDEKKPKKSDKKKDKKKSKKNEKEKPKEESPEPEEESEGKKEEPTKE